MNYGSVAALRFPLTQPTQDGGPGGLAGNGQSDFVLEP